jgi:hypothetical protein
MAQWNVDSNMSANANGGKHATSVVDRHEKDDKSTDKID